MDSNREGVAGALVGAMVGVALPGFSKFLLWIVAIVVVAMLHRHFEHAIESRMGTLATVIAALLVGPLFTLLRGSMESVFSFFYFFITVAAGYTLGSMTRKPDEDDVEN